MYRAKRFFLYKKKKKKLLWRHYKFISGRMTIIRCYTKFFLNIIAGSNIRTPPPIFFFRVTSDDDHPTRDKFIIISKK